MFAFVPIADIIKFEPEMKRLKVSQVARSSKGFLSAYKRVNGNAEKLSIKWKQTRDNFIKRHLPQYKLKPTHRRLLALYAWAYKPSMQT